MLNDPPSEIPPGIIIRSPLEFQTSSPHIPLHQETPILEKNEPLDFQMQLHSASSPVKPSPPKKRIWCANELAILFFGLWLLSHIFPFIWHLEHEGHGGHESSDHFFDDPDYPGAQKVFLHISMAIMAFSLLCFTALLITTRLIFPNGKVAIYLVQEQKRIISV
jgi:hypothetical protein